MIESRETREAVDVRNRAQHDLRAHLADCAICAPKPTRRGVKTWCPAGGRHRDALKLAEAVLAESRRLDALPMPAQDALPGLESES